MSSPTKNMITSFLWAGFRLGNGRDPFSGDGGGDKFDKYLRDSFLSIINCFRPPNNLMLISHSRLSICLYGQAGRPAVQCAFGSGKGGTD